MPSDVALTTSAWSATASLRRSQSMTRRPGRWRASSSAWARVRLASVTVDALVLQRRGDGARRAAGAQQQRRAGGGIDAMRAQIGEEAPAVGVAAGDAAVGNTSVLTAPARRAESSTVSQIAKAASLCGRVTLAPANPAASRPRTAVAKSSGRIGSGI